MQFDDLDFADDLALLSHTQQQMQEKTTSVAAASAPLGLNIHKGKSKILRCNTACTNPITIDGEDLENGKTHYQQQPTMGENKSDPRGGRNQEESLEVDRTHIEESTRLHHKTSPHLESSRLKEKRKTKEHITSRNGDGHEKNEQELDGTRKEGPGQSGSENAGWRPMLH
ncbi:unnamed protein product [Schistosoma mattheei]|uniref:Uncharacterized protein n=1 Tax=Schistosoma mattheei TaxID=31246 RepID=A0A183Q2E0_9TREM|nr:unnamed protein product [Schistosoma mattheei]